MRNFTSVIGAAVTQLNEPPCLLWVGSWSIPFRTIMNTKQCETRELSGHPLLNGKCTGLPGCFYSPKCKLNYNFKGHSVALLC